jgi:hypothetical protein
VFISGSRVHLDDEEVLIGEIKTRRQLGELDGSALAALEFLREGDTLVVTKLDRLARSVIHLGEIVEGLRGKAVALRILDLGVDTSSATGELVLNVMRPSHSSSER